MNTLAGKVLTLPKMSGSVSTPKSLSGNVGAKTINIGGKGDDGATFIPSVSDDGIISWTNDKELPNPEPVNIKGDPGYTPIKGVDYFDGAKGDPGISPHIGENGNWFIGDLDTGISASGKFTTDETLTLKDGVLSVNTAKEPDPDNTLPITSAAVAMTVGNIGELLKTI